MDSHAVAISEPTRPLESPQEADASVPEVDTSAWAETAFQAMEELAETALGCEATIVSKKAELPEDTVGAYVALVHDGGSVQVGVLAGPSGSEALTRILLGMEEDEPFESESDVADGMGEIANILAGLLKGPFDSKLPGLELGLPLVVRGRLEHPGAIEFVEAHIRLGEHDTYLVVAAKRGRGKRARK